MKILAFETSCDDTAVAVVKDGTEVLSSVRMTQKEHEKWGGVVPEIAARLHAENWEAVLEKCLKEAQCALDDIDFLAVTKGPGLQTSLLTGTTASSFLSLLYQKPLIPVHHVYGHMCANFLGRKTESVVFPAMVLTVSGGHTQMHLWESPTQITLLGTTLDDAAGEAFDKVAKMLGLGYPGGPIVSQYADKGDRRKIDLPKIYLDRASLDFSFSGLKASVYRLLEQNENWENRADKERFIADICASFEYTVGKIFAKKVTRALEKFPQIKQIHFTGGVSANRYLREILTEICQARGVDFLFPQHIEYSTDNAAMIGAAAYQLMKSDPQRGQIQHVDAQSRLDLEGFLGED